MNKNKTNDPKQEKYSLKTVIYDEKCLEMDYFEELLQDLEKNGIRTEVSENRSYGPDHLYICAQEEGVIRAKKNDLAFVCCRVQDRDAQCVIEGFDEVGADFIEKMYRRKHGLPWLICESKRLLIREFSPDDGIEIFPEKSDEPDYNSLYIKNIYGFFGYGVWALIDKESRDIIGKAGFMNSERLDGIELGYEIFGKYRGRGYATEACRALVKTAWTTYGIEKLFAFTETSNTASKRVLEKTGFIYCTKEGDIEKYVLNVPNCVDNGLLRV